MFKNLMISLLVFAGIFTFTFPAQAEGAEETYTVQKGDSLYSIASNYGISTHQLKAVNDKSSYMIYPGEQLQMPVLPEEWEKDLLARLVEAEAKGESYAGKVGVATVVLNRVESDKFPDSIYGVIYDGIQFSPVLNGTIEQPASQESKQAVEEAVAYQGYDRESLFFYNPSKASSSYLSSKEVTTVIGDHVFLR